MRFFRWNTFTVIGLVLLAIGVYGLIKGPLFQFDAGLPSEPFEGFYYLLVGVLMIVNGCVAPKVVVEEAQGAPAAAQVDGIQPQTQTGPTTARID